MDEPGVKAISEFCHNIVPSVLRDVCGVESALADAIGSDILTRAQAFAALDQAAQKVLAAPFIEDVVEYEPAEVSVDVRAATAVVVRNSLLEEAHACGQVNAGGIKSLTTFGARVVSQYLSLERRQPCNPGTANPFLNLRDTFPRTWAAFSALSTAVSSGGRVGYTASDAPVPEWPDPGQIIPASRSEQDADVVVQSAIDSDFNEELVATLHQVIDNEISLLVPSLSRVSRNMDVLFYVVELLLAHRRQILTTNYFVRTNDVWVRKGHLLPAISNMPTLGVENLDGLSGSHRKVAKDVAQSLDAHRDG